MTVGSPEFRRWLLSAYFQQYHSAPSPSAVQSALMLVDCKGARGGGTPGTRPGREHGRHDLPRPWQGVRLGHEGRLGGGLRGTQLGLLINDKH